MLEFVKAGGYMMYVLLLVAAVTLALAVRSWLRLRRDPESDAMLETRIDAILFWGGYGLVLGVLGTLVGIAQAASAIQAAGGASSVLIWGGIQVALNTTIFGLLIFSVSLLLWFALRFRYRRRLAAT